jgi:hypothetical protein
MLSMLYWEEITGLPVSSVNIVTGRELDKLPYGMCRVQISSGVEYLGF